MCGNQVFSDRSVILVGDFGQLLPVLDELMYSQVLQRDPLSNEAVAIYQIGRASCRERV